MDSSDFVNINVMEVLSSRVQTGPEIKIRSESTSEAIKQPTQAGLTARSFYIRDDRNGTSPSLYTLIHPESPHRACMLVYV